MVWAIEIVFGFQAGRAGQAGQAGQPQAGQAGQACAAACPNLQSKILEICDFDPTLFSFLMGEFASDKGQSPSSSTRASQSCGFLLRESAVHEYLGPRAYQYTSVSVYQYEHIGVSAHWCIGVAVCLLTSASVS